jgi:hypothetical protein
VVDLYSPSQQSFKLLFAQKLEILDKFGQVSRGRDKGQILLLLRFGDLDLGSLCKFQGVYSIVTGEDVQRILSAQEIFERDGPVHAHWHLVVITFSILP